jgi:hypothetical protein
MLLLLLPKIVVWQRITANDPARAWLKRWDPLFLKGLYYIGSNSLACNRRFKRATTRELDARAREGRKETREGERRAREDTERDETRCFQGFSLSARYNIGSFFPCSNDWEPNHLQFFFFLGALN